MIYNHSFPVDYIVSYRDLCPPGGVGRFGDVVCQDPPDFGTDDTFFLVGDK